ncbi:MAG: hypothetical protein ACREF4_06705 [Gammaproteobacteria bacterium]
MDHTQRVLKLSAFILITFVVAFPAAAADIVAWQAGPSGLVIKPLVQFDHGVLTVNAPDGVAFREEFKPGTTVTFTPYSRARYQPPDGAYVWEVVLARPSAVDPRLREAAKAARQSGETEGEVMYRAALSRVTQVQSGGFRIVRGQIVPSDQVEPNAKPQSSNGGRDVRDPFKQANWIHDDPSLQFVDQVIPDDLIVQGSLCVGFDCVNNENFGFDTIRLKENNLRIKFEDTSVGSFPTNDWQLTANDSASGGQSKFSIEDITGARIPFTIEAGSTTNSIYVDSTGRVGFRTSTPVLDLHVNTSNTPAMRLEQNSSGGFTAQTWDVAGNEANFFVRDVTGGSRLPFRIRPGAPTSSIDISAAGDVGIGTASPSAKLHVSESVNDDVQVLAQNSNTGTSAFVRSIVQSDTSFLDMRSHAAARTISRWGQTLGGWSEILYQTGNGLAVGTQGNVPLILGTNSANRIQITGGGAIQLAGAAFVNCAQLNTNGSGAIGCAASTQELKNVAGDLPPQVALANVMALRPQMGAYKVTPDEVEHWLIAEQAAAVDPAFVTLRDGKPYTIKTQNVVTDLIAVVQQQQRQIEEQRRQIEQQQQRLETLERATGR